MEISNIAVIINPDKYTLDCVKNDIEEEGYKHNFCFVNYVELEEGFKALDIADEIWIWGDCSDQIYYKYAKTESKEVWKMAK